MSNNFCSIRVPQSLRNQIINSIKTKIPAHFPMSIMMFNSSTVLPDLHQAKVTKQDNEAVGIIAVSLLLSDT